VFYRVWFVSALKFNCFEFCIVCTEFFRLFVECNTEFLNLWAGATQYHLRYHPDSNGGRNPGCRSTWPETVFALPLLTKNCNNRKAMCVLSTCKTILCISLCNRRGTLSWHSLYTVQFVKYNGDTRLHCWGRDYCSLVKRNDACDYGLHLEAQTTIKVILQNTFFFLKLQLPWCCAESYQLFSPSSTAFLCSCGSDCWGGVTSAEVMRWEVK